MKKSHLIFLFCLLFCGQMFAQRPTPTTPVNPKDPDAPAMTGIIEELPEPCEGVSYKITIDSIVCGATSTSLLEMIPSDVSLSNPELPESFDIVKISLNHPLEFTSYGFELSLEQPGSSKPVVLLFIHYEHQIEITPVNETELENGPTRLNIKITNTDNGDDGGVATTATVEGIWGGSGEQCVNASVEEQQLASGIFYEMCGYTFSE